ncbi:MAG: MATE family efflux transporter [Candidatus Zixiibacteriota bacterium]|nr:MAG: MATE family efflux transporter [candidate division Zixibacteria bacterium]
MPDDKDKSSAPYPEPLRDEEITGFSTGMEHALSKTPEPLPPEFARGSIIRVILRMGLPSVIGFLAMNIYDMADIFWVARLGPQFVAAITIFEGFYWVLIFTNEIAGLGSVAVISRRYGEGNLASAEAAIKDTFILKGICALVSGVAGWLLLRPLMQLMGAQGEVIELGVQFGRWHMLGMIVYFSSYTVFTSLRCIEAPRLAMTVMLIGSGLNLALDPFLIFGWGPFPELGIAGAAIASLISYGATLVIGLYVFFSGRAPVKLHWRSVVPVSLRNQLEMMRIGLPGGINMVSFSLSRAVVLPLVAAFGTEVVAAYGMGLRVTQIGILVVWGLGMGVSPLVGNLLGAGLMDRAWQTARKSLGLAVAVMSVLALATIALADPIVRFFFQDPRVVEAGVELLRIYSLALPGIGLWIIMESSFHGAGDNVPPMVLSIVTSWAIEIPLILFFTRALGYDQTAIWWVRVFYATSGAVAAVALLRTRRWMHKRV